MMKPPNTALPATCRRGRAREWLGRYAPAEAAAILGALLAAGVASHTGGAAVTAFAAAAGETVAFYAVLLVRDLCRHSTQRSRPRAWRTIRDLLMEFGPAELLDTFVVRPFAIYAAAGLAGNLTIGVILGKIAADVVFYTLAIIGYELRKAFTD